MAQESKPVIQVQELFQVGIVVRDVEKTAQLYQDLLGIGPWSIMDVGPYIDSVTYKGKRVEKPSFLVGMAMAGNMQIELIQPINEDLPYTDFLKEHGEGLHHVGHIQVPDVDAAVRDLEAQGFPCVFAGDSPQTKFAYVDMSKSLGVIVELVQA